MQPQNATWIVEYFPRKGNENPTKYRMTWKQCETARHAVFSQKFAYMRYYQEGHENWPCFHSFEEK